jgi:MFS family permease
MTTSAVGNLGRPTNPPSLWRDRAFNVFWSGQVVSMLGDTFSFLAFPLLMLRATGSVRDMGLVAAAGGAGQVLSLACAGAIVDRVSPIPLMVGCDVARAALLAAIPLCWHTLGPCVPLVYVVAVVTGLLGDVFAVAYQAAVTTMVRPAQLIDVNSRLQASMAVTMAVGPALAGVTCEVFGPAQAVGLDALSFLLSAASLWTLRPAFAGLRSGPSRAPTSMRDGLRYIWNHPVLRSLMIVLSLATAVTAGVVPLFVFRLEHDLASTDAMVGIIIGAAGVGGVLGAVAAAKLRDRVGFAACFVSATLIEGICISGGLASP